jgi:hypothetical protein
MNVFRWSVTALIISAALAMATPARADGDSYIRYLNDHGIFVPGINDAVRISRGANVCTDLHNGMTPEQVDANPIVYFDLRGVIDAPSTSSARTHWGIEARANAGPPSLSARHYF